MGRRRPIVLHDIYGLCIGIRGSDVVIELHQRRDHDALRAAKTDLTGLRIERGDDPRQGVVTLTERGPRLVSAPHRIGLGQRGLARDRHLVEKEHAGALGMGAHLIQDGGERSPFAVIIRIRTANTGAGPFPDDVEPRQDGVDAGRRTGVEPWTGAADARQGPAGLILTAGARVALDEMLHLCLGRVTGLAPRGKKRACARVPCVS